MKPTNPPVKFETPLLMAFWRYDTFPYCLCGTVTELREDGLVMTSNYGSYHFKPFLLLPLASGQELEDKLEALRSDHDRALAKVNKEFDNKLKEIITIPKKVVDI